MSCGNFQNLKKSKQKQLKFWAKPVFRNYMFHPSSVQQNQKLSVMYLQFQQGSEYCLIKTGILKMQGIGFFILSLFANSLAFFLINLSTKFQKRVSIDKPPGFTQIISNKKFLPSEKTFEILTFLENYPPKSPRDFGDQLA